MHISSLCIYSCRSLFLFQHPSFLDISLTFWYLPTLLRKKLGMVTYLHLVRKLSLIAGKSTSLLHTRRHVHTRTHTHTRARAHMHTHTHAGTHAGAHTHTHTCRHACTQSHTHTHTYTHTRTAGLVMCGVLVLFIHAHNFLLAYKLGMTSRIIMTSVIYQKVRVSLYLYQ